ncbi:MAG: putative addiction module antidote protein [Gammaproteobacteria bacterium]|nr:MAG: putative addiction module antidote protein [Gammaproteobacteria bacterium]
MVKVSDLPEFDLAEQLKTDKDIATYMAMVLEDGDTDEFIRAVGYVAKAKGMTQIANSTGLGRESLYKTLKSGAKPQFDTIKKVVEALGCHLSVVTH